MRQPVIHIQRWESIILVALSLIYLGICLPNLDVAPVAHEDESWQASTGWKLAMEGVLGSDMMAGFYGMERHYYGYMPLHSFALAAMFRLAGLGLYQARLVSVLAGWLILLLTYRIGRRWLDQRAGLIAASLLLFMRLTGVSTYRLSGIPLLDVAHIARYDILVPVFGLTALLLYDTARQRPDSRLFFLAGTLAGLSGLSHLYGLFWCIAIGLLALWDRTRWRDLVLMGLGFSLPWGIYSVYVLANYADWVGQTRLYADRFDLLNPRWYWDNLRLEYQRYNLSFHQGWYRPGVWFSLIGLPASYLTLGWQAVRRANRPARAVLVPGLTLPVLFALFIKLKQPSYLVTLMPLFSLALAWGIVTWWDWSRRKPARWVLRWILVLALLAVGAEGLPRTFAFAEQASGATSYPVFINQVRAEIPSGARVLGLQRYWLGLEDLDYRSWAVVFLLGTDHGATIEQALDQISPDLILIDPAMLRYLASEGVKNAAPQDIRAWMADNQYHLAHVVEDPSYGRMEFWR